MTDADFYLDYAECCNNSFNKAGEFVKLVVSAHCCNCPISDEKATIMCSNRMPSSFTNIISHDFEANESTDPKPFPESNNSLSIKQANCKP